LRTPSSRPRALGLACAFAAVLLALPAASSAAWNQPGGGPGRSSAVDLADGPLDVLAHANVLQEGGRLDTLATGVPRIVVAGREALVLQTPVAPATPSLSPSADCRLLAVGDGLAPREDARFACPAGAHLLAYLEGPRLVLLGISGSPEVLPGVPGVPAAVGGGILEVRAVRLDGSTAWSWQPTLAVAPGTTADPFGCPAATLDEARGLLVVACSNAAGANVVARLDAAKGTAGWTVVVSPDTPAPPAGAPQPPTQANATGAGRFAIESATLVGSDVFLKGTVPAGAASGAAATGGALPSAAVAGLAWLNASSGERVGFLDTGVTGAAGLAVPAPGAPTTGSGLGSEAMASDGRLAVGFLGTSLWFVTPGTAAATPQEGIALEAPLALAAPPAWGRDVLVAPTTDKAYVVPRSLHGAPDFWGGDSHGTIGTALVDRDRSAYATVQVVLEGGATQDRLERFALPTPTTLSRIPLPRSGAHGTGTPSSPPALVPLPDGTLLSVDAAGDVARLGVRPAGQGPALRLSDDYPGTDQDVQLGVTPPAGATVRSLVVGWGDGDVTDWAANATAPTKRYTADGDVTLRATAVLADGTTSTSEVAVHPGRARPNPGLVEVLFRPENQNYTFFAIGLLVTLVTSLVAAVGALRGRRRLDKYLRQLVALRDRGRREPFEAVVDLHAFRAAREADLARGHLDNGQFTILDAQARTVLELLRSRILGPFVGRVSDRFTHALDTALADGAFDGDEASRLGGMVGHERGLTKAEKDRLRALVRTWDANL